MALLFLTLAVGPASADLIYSTDFNNGLDNGNLTIQDTSGFSVSISGGAATFTKAAGTGNGDGQVLTTFDVDGDFTATAVMTRSDLTAGGEFGLAAYYASDFADAFFFDGAAVAGNVFPGASNNLSDSTSTVTFEIQRIGTTFYSEYNNGSGLTTITSGTGTADPVVIGLFLTQEDSFTVANSGYASDLVIDADSFSSASAPEPSTALLAILPLGFAAFRFRRRR